MQKYLSSQQVLLSFSFLLESHKIEEIEKNIIEERFFQARQKPIKISDRPNWKPYVIADISLTLVEYLSSRYQS